MYFDEIYDYDEDDYDWHWANDEKAKLISPRIDGSQKQCLKFYYHMQGINIGYFIYRVAILILEYI